MKRYFSMLSVALLLIVTIFPSVSAVSAQEAEKEYKDGTYDIPVKVLHADKDEDSTMQDYVDSGKLTVDGDKFLVKLLLDDKGMIGFVQTIINGEYVDASLGKDSETGFMTAAFEVKDINELLDGKVQVSVPGLYEKAHDVRFSFDVSNVPEKPIEVTRLLPAAKAINLDNGDYIINVAAKHATEDKESGVARFIGKEAKVTVKGNETLLTLTINEHSTVTGLQVEGNEPISEKVSDDGKARTATYKVTSLKDIYTAQTQYQMGAHKGDQPLRLFLDGASVKPVIEPEKPTEPNEPEWKDIDYTVDVPTMERYIKSVKTLETEGKKEVKVRFNSAKYITDFKVNTGNGLVALDKENIEEDFVDYTFTVEDFNVSVPSHIVIDAMGRVMKHDFTLYLGTAEPAPVEPERTEPEIPENSELEDGDYLIESNILHESNDKPSTAAGYIQNPVKLTVKDGKNTVFFTITDNKSIKDLKIKQNGKLQSAKLIKENKKNNTRVVSFEVDDFATVLEGQFHVFIAEMNYDAKPNVRISLNKESIKEDDGSLPVIPDKKEGINDGEYTINYRVLHATKFEKSRMGDYLVAPANLTVKDGKNIVTLTINDHKTVKDLKIKQNGKNINVTEVSKDEFKNTRDVQFEIDNLDGEYATNISVYVKEADYTGNYDIRLFFEENSVKERNDSEIPEIENPKPADPETPEVPEPEEDLETDARYVDGTYELPLEVWHADKDEASTMEKQVERPGALIVKDGVATVILTLSNSNMVEYLQVEQNGKFINAKDVAEVSLLSAIETRDVEFIVDDLDEILNAKVKVNVPGVYSMEHEVRFVFDASEIPLIDPDAKPVPKPEVKPEVKPTPKPEESIQIKGKYLDGEYKLPFKIKQGDTDKNSEMEKFVQTPGELVIKDGDATVFVAVDQSQLITKFQTLFNGDFVNAKKGTSNGDITEYSFKVENLDALLDAKVGVDVPGLYSTTHDVRFKFDTSKLPLNPDYDPTKEELEGLPFDRNGDAGSNGNGDTVTNNTNNPKTADTSQLALFASLLAGSALFLIRQFRRKRIGL